MSCSPEDGQQCWYFSAVRVSFPGNPVKETTHKYTAERTNPKFQARILYIITNATFFWCWIAVVLKPLAPLFMSLVESIAVDNDNEVTFFPAVQWPAASCSQGAYTRLPTRYLSAKFTKSQSPAIFTWRWVQRCSLLPMVLSKVRYINKLAWETCPHMVLFCLYYTVSYHVVSHPITLYFNHVQNGKPTTTGISHQIVRNLKQENHTISIYITYMKHITCLLSLW